MNLFDRLIGYPEGYVLSPTSPGGRDLAAMAERTAEQLEFMPEGPQDVEDWQRAFLQIAATLRARHADVRSTEETTP